jgi:hypothetical protein
MPMSLTSGGSRERGIKWRRELAPVIAVAALFADYLSPAELWTILLPLGGAVLLLALRKWTAAAAVLLLSSWFVVPAAVITVQAIDDSRGEHRLFALDGAPGPLLDKAFSEGCSAGSIDFEVLPIGPGHLINPSWVLRDNIATFVALHNAIVIERARASGLCPSTD